MSKSIFRIAAFAASAMLAFAASAQAQDLVSIEVGSATGNQGATVQVDVTMTLLEVGTEVAGTQNDITYAGELGGGEVKIAAKANGKPDCAVNPEIDKGGTSFAFQPSMCDPATDCTGVRALVLALDNVTPIPDGSVLYTCNVAIAADAPAGDYALTNSNVGASDPDGGALATTGTDGTVTVEEVVAAAAIIHVGSTSGNPGQPDLSIDVTLETPLLGTEVAGTQNDITFSGGLGAAILIKAKENGKPDCAVNPEIDKGGTSFAFQPSMCTGEECTAVRALVLALDNVAPIPDGSVLYSCAIEITETAEVGQTYDLTCSNAGASDPGGGALETSCTDGTVEVGGIIETPTDTPTITPTPEDTPTPVATNTSTATPTNTRKPTPSGGNDDDGCAIVAPAESGYAWMLLLPALGLLWLRRRSR